jgi:DNA uptake protein ComE-like DNA-binding protein
MTAIYVISIKSVISSELLGSDTAKLFITDELSKIVVDHILVDFSQVKTMDHTFALQYLTSKQDINRNKVIKAVNMSENIYTVFQAAQEEIENSKRKNININNDFIETANTVLVPSNS